MNLLGVLAGLEGEVVRDQGGAHVPGEASDIGRTSRIASVDDDQLAGDRLLTLLDPNLPIVIALPESVMISGDAIDGGRPDYEAGFQFLGSEAVGIAPAEKILERQRDTELVVDDIKGFPDR